MLLLLSFSVSTALAQDGEPHVGDLNYGGTLSEEATGYSVGKSVSISHSGGNIIVNCSDTRTLSARMPYSLTGAGEGALESFGKGIGLKASGDGKGGGVVSTMMPKKTSGVSTVDAPLTVNVPNGASSISVSQSGSGWVSVRNCSGALKVTSGAGGLAASGAFTAVNLNATGANAEVEIADGAVLTGTSSVSAPKGKVSLKVATAQGGKISAKAAEVSVQQMVSGTNDPGYVSGTFGIGGPSITLSAGERVDVTAE